MSVYILYPVSKRYGDRQQYEVENGQGQRVYMTVDEINHENSDPIHDHEFKNRGITDTICHLESCTCGAVREAESIDVLEWLRGYFAGVE
jgi:hypothetical protein